MNELSVYLAHPITANNHPTESWKSKIVACTPRPVNWLDPFRYGLDNDIDWKEIIKRNVADIAVADMVIAYLDTWSWGVISECNIARMLGVPVIGYRSKNWVRSPYERNCVRFVTGSFEDIGNHINRFRKHK